MNVPGLPELCAQLSPDTAGALMQRIGDSLKTSAPAPRGQLSDTSFGALASATRGSLGLAQKITDAIKAGGLEAPKVSESRIGLVGAGLTSDQRMLALRYVVEQFAQKGKVEGDGDIASSFALLMDETQMRLAR